MILIESTKYSCMECIRGHRSSLCRHHSRPLLQVRSKGRPNVYANGNTNHRIAVFAQEIVPITNKKDPIIVTSCSEKQIIDIASGNLLGPHLEADNSIRPPPPVINSNSFVITLGCGCDINKVQKSCGCSNKKRSPNKSKILKTYISNKLKQDSSLNFKDIDLKLEDNINFSDIDVKLAADSVDTSCSTGSCLCDGNCNCPGCKVHGNHILSIENRGINGSYTADSFSTGLVGSNSEIDIGYRSDGVHDKHNHGLTNNYKNIVSNTLIPNSTTSSNSNGDSSSYQNGSFGSNGVFSNNSHDYGTSYSKGVDVDNNNYNLGLSRIDLNGSSNHGLVNNGIMNSTSRGIVNNGTIGSSNHTNNGIIGTNHELGNNSLMQTSLMSDTAGAINNSFGVSNGRIGNFNKQINNVDGGKDESSNGYDRGVNKIDEGVLSNGLHGGINRNEVGSLYKNGVHRDNSSLTPAGQVNSFNYEFDRFNLGQNQISNQFVGEESSKCSCSENSCDCTNCETHGIINGLKLDELFGMSMDVPDANDMGFDNKNHSINQQILHYQQVFNSNLSTILHNNNSVKAESSCCGKPASENVNNSSSNRPNPTEISEKEKCCTNKEEFVRCMSS